MKYIERNEVRMSKTITRRGPKPTKRNAIVLRMREIKRATSADLGVSTAFLETLNRAGIVRVVEHQRTDHKGRPRNVYSLDKRGQGIALNLSKAQKAA